MVKMHGSPCWYELSTSDGSLGAAEGFYGDVLGWAFKDAGMEGFELPPRERGRRHGRGADEHAAPTPAAMPPFWMIYFAVNDADKAAADIKAAGGQIYREPADIPETGRFAVVADPQGAAFGILQPSPMADGGAGGNAFDQQKAGHGNWNELMSSDPAAGFGFYSDLFGWQKSRPWTWARWAPTRSSRTTGTDIGGMMGLGNSPVPAWLPYFGTNGVEAAMGRIAQRAARSPTGRWRCPGGAFIAVAQDPQGAWFAVVGPEGGTH